MAPDNAGSGGRGFSSQVDMARDEADNNCDFLKKLLRLICCGRVCNIISAVFLCTLPVAHIVVGALFLDDCPRERLIPIYLLVAGVFGVVEGLVRLAELIYSAVTDQRTRHLGFIITDAVLTTFLLAWFIAGSVWIFRTLGSYQSIVSGLPSYCDRTLFLYAFWTQVAVYVIMALSLCATCVLLCVACCKKR